MMRFWIFVGMAVWLCPSGGAEAQSRVAVLENSPDPRGSAELVICSQNLGNYGQYEEAAARVGGISKGFFERKERALVYRFVRRRCDVVAVQELLGKTEQSAQQALQRLAQLLRKRTNRMFQAVTGASNDSWIRQGFLIARDRAEVLNKLSYARVELPKLAEEERQRMFARGPLEVQLRVKPRGSSSARIVTVVNFHFKSKSTKGGTDPAGLEFEPYRMQMAEALRRIVDIRHQESLARGETVLVLVGDRNSHADVASAKILEGMLSLAHFRGSGPCRLSKRGMPLCQGGSLLPQRYFSVLTGDPQVRQKPGTLRYGKVYAWVDDLLMPAESLAFAWRDPATEGKYSCGVEYDPEEASDHALVWVTLNW